MRNSAAFYLTAGAYLKYANAVDLLITKCSERIISMETNDSKLTARQELVSVCPDTEAKPVLLTKGAI